MACGPPVVASPVGVNRQSVECGVSEWLADTGTGRSVVVIFELVAYGDYGNCRVVFDFEQRDAARSPEWNDQLS